jgi:hypothetical protein
MRSVPLLRLLGLHVLPGMICVILGALLLSLWELRRLTASPGKATPPWLLPAAGIAVSVVALGLIASRFIAIQLVRPTGQSKDIGEKVTGQ